MQETARGYSPTLLGWIVMLSPLAIVFAMSFGQARMSEGTLQTLFLVYAALMGASLSTIFIAYTQSSIAGAFFATAAGFAGLSLYGYTTKQRPVGPRHLPDHGPGRADRRVDRQPVPAIGHDERW